MKKLMSAILALALSASVLTVGASASKDGASWGDIPLTKEKITIDGKMDYIYKKGLKITPDTNKGGGKARADAYYLHDGKSIYIFSKVADHDVNPISADRDKTFWEEDGVEITFDTKNDGSTRYKTTVCHDGWFRGSGSPETVEQITAMWEIKVAKTSVGYDVEAKFTLNNGATTGSKVGIQYCVNDMTADAKSTQLNKAHKLGATSNEVGKFDYTVLSDKEVKNDAKKPAASAAATADLSSIVAVAGAMALAGAVVAKKKH